jgi:hypothetical protein
MHYTKLGLPWGLKTTKEYKYMYTAKLNVSGRLLPSKIR